MRPYSTTPALLQKPSLQRLTCVLTAVGIAAGACDGGLPAHEADEPAQDEATPLEGEGSGGLGMAPHDETVVPPAAPPQPVVAMAHDVTTWTMRTEARGIAGVAAVGEHFLVGAMLRDGWRVELHTMPTATAAATLVAAHTHPSFETGPPVLAAFAEVPADGPAAVVAWLQEGVLLVQSISIVGGTLAMGEARVAYMATDTHEITGQPVVAEAHPEADEPWLICARENIRGLVCAGMNAQGEVDDWKAVGALRGHEPRALRAVSEGYVGLAAACRSEDDCSSESIVTLLLDRNGQPLRKKGTRLLAMTQSRRALVAIPTERGLFVAGRRRAGQYVTAWHVSHDGTRELDGRFDRLQGGLALGHGEVWLLEESPLMMRGGFPVGLLRPARWSLEHGREEPLGWPRHVDDALPGQPGQKVLTHRGLVAMLMPIKGGIAEATFLHLKPNGEIPAPVKARKSEQKRKKRRLRTR